MVLDISVCERLSCRRGRDAERQTVAEVKVVPVYVNGLYEERMSLRFAEVSCEWYLTSDTDLYVISSVAFQCSILCEDGCEKGLRIYRSTRVSGIWKV